MEHCHLDCCCRHLLRCCCGGCWLRLLDRCLLFECHLLRRLGGSLHPAPCSPDHVAHDEDEQARIEDKHHRGPVGLDCVLLRRDVGRPLPRRVDLPERLHRWWDDQGEHAGDDKPCDPPRHRSGVWELVYEHVRGSGWSGMWELACEYVRGSGRIAQ